MRDHSPSTRSGLARCFGISVADVPELAITDRDTVLDMDLRETVERALGSLDPRQRFVVVERFLHNRTNDDIGRELGISGSAVSLLATAGLKRLQCNVALRDWVGLAAA
jgi:RNA polymerase sigma factor (sigma-70 family)